MCFDEVFRCRIVLTTNHIIGVTADLPVERYAILAALLDRLALFNAAMHSSYASQLLT